MTDVAIIGAGYSGLTLALRLQQLGVDTTLYAESTPDEMRVARLPNTVGRFSRTLARERALGLDDDAGRRDAIAGLQFSAGPPLGIGYAGRFTEPPRATDFRVLLPGLLERYDTRGGRVVIGGPIDAAAVERRAEHHDLTIVAVGRHSIGALFPVDEERSPYRRPQRLVLAALFDGLLQPEGPAVSLNVSPGAGELVQMPMGTSRGPGTSIMLNAHPGGPLAALAAMPATDERFIPAFVDTLRQHAPIIAARICSSGLAVSGPQDWLHGAITPTVRRSWHVFASGKLALAIGDAWITNDPITAQGANLGSHCAWLAADHIARGGPFDAAFGRRLEQAMWADAESIVAFTNAFLQPPPPHVAELAIAAATHQAVADRYVDLFNDPTAMWRTLSSPDAVTRFIEAALDDPPAVRVAAD